MYVNNSKRFICGTCTWNIVKYRLRVGVWEITLLKTPRALIPWHKPDPLACWNASGLLSDFPRGCWTATTDVLFCVFSLYFLNIQKTLLHHSFSAATFRNLTETSLRAQGAPEQGLEHALTPRRPFPGWSSRASYQGRGSGTPRLPAPPRTHPLPSPCGSPPCRPAPATGWGGQSGAASSAATARWASGPPRPGTRAPPSCVRAAAHVRRRAGGASRAPHGALRQGEWSRLWCDLAFLPSVCFPKSV